jgi:hypothetical protein
MLFVCLIFINAKFTLGGSLGRDCMVVFDLQLPIQSMPITTKVVSSNPAYSE